MLYTVSELPSALSRCPDLPLLPPFCQVYYCPGMLLIRWNRRLNIPVSSWATAEGASGPGEPRRCRRKRPDKRWPAGLSARRNGKGIVERRSLSFLRMADWEKLGQGKCDGEGLRRSGGCAGGEGQRRAEGFGSVASPGGRIRVRPDAGAGGAGRRGGWSGSRVVGLGWGFSGGMGVCQYLSRKSCVRRKLWRGYGADGVIC
jgi:hypothetical protein